MYVRAIKGFFSLLELPNVVEMASCSVLNKIKLKKISIAILIHFVFKANANCAL